MDVTFRCAGCGTVTGGLSRYPFRCAEARALDDVDHVMVPRVRPAESPPRPGRQDAGPFARYRERLSAYALARAQGLSDEGFCKLVERLDRAITAVDGRGFVETPFRREDRLVTRLGGATIFVKDETGNVSGSHKARHLAGIMLYLLVMERLEELAQLRENESDGEAKAHRLATGDWSKSPQGTGSEDLGRAPLAIASCGNAALAAAVVARAADWPLQVFVPASANAAVVSRLDALGAHVVICRRQAGVSGDPCYLAFREAVDAGAIPFCCQGSDNGLTIEGGETLAWEMIDGLEGRPLDAVFVQVGGGALASAIVQGFTEAQRAGAIDHVPRIYAVQTAGGYPLGRAYSLLCVRIAQTLRETGGAAVAPATRARAIARHPDVVEEHLAYARSHRSRFMWPWETEPRSIAHGILDDETYDWAAVVEGMLKTGGRPIIVGESQLMAANQLARRATGIDVDHTGSAGLAGLMDALAEEPDLRDQAVAVVFSGIRRQ